MKPSLQKTVNAAPVAPLSSSLGVKRFVDVRSNGDVRRDDVDRNGGGVVNGGHTASCGGSRRNGSAGGVGATRQTAEARVAERGQRHRQACDEDDLSEVYFSRYRRQDLVYPQPAAAGSRPADCRHRPPFAELQTTATEDEEEESLYLGYSFSQIYASTKNGAVHLQQRLKTLSTELVTLRKRLSVDPPLDDLSPPPPVHPFSKELPHHHGPAAAQDHQKSYLQPPATAFDQYKDPVTPPACTYENIVFRQCEGDLKPLTSVPSSLQRHPASLAGVATSGESSSPPRTYAEVYDLTHTSGPLTEDSVLRTLYARFSQRQYFTSIGQILISLNSYSDPHNDLTLTSVGGTNYPELRKVVRESVRQQSETGYSQAIVLSGESGSGKTFMSMVLLRQLFDVAGGGTETDSFKHLAAAFTVLRSLGTAYTATNATSSRIGHFIEVQATDGVLYRTKIHCYLLDQSRIVKQTPNERNYNIFFEMLAGLPQEEKAQLYLDRHSASSLNYLNGRSGNEAFGTPVLAGVAASLRAGDGGGCGGVIESGDLQWDAQRAAERFHNWRSALTLLGLSAGDVLRVLAAILLLGNVRFVNRRNSGQKDSAADESDGRHGSDASSGSQRDQLSSTRASVEAAEKTLLTQTTTGVEDGADVESGVELKSVANLLGISTVALFSALTRRTTTLGSGASRAGPSATVGGSDGCDVITASINRDALAKALYCRTLAAVIRRANSLRGAGFATATVSVTDSNDSTHLQQQKVCGFDLRFSNSSRQLHAQPLTSSDHRQHPHTVAAAGSAGVTNDHPRNCYRPMSVLNSAVKQATNGFIGILDMYGFENNSLGNRLEQLCLNLTAETLQHYYNSYVFKSQLDACRQEEVTCDLEVEYADRVPCIDLIASARTGLLGMCDTDTQVGTAQTFVARILAQHKANPILFRPKVQQGELHDSNPSSSTSTSTTFAIRHFAGVVTYDATDFLECNRDTISGTIVNLFSKTTCNFGFASHLFVSELNTLMVRRLDPSAPPNGKFRIVPSVMSPSTAAVLAEDGVLPTLTQDFHTRLDRLMRMLVHAKPHFIRCIRSSLGPNGLPQQSQQLQEQQQQQQQQPFFDRYCVMRQLRALQVLETVNLMACGYAHRMHFVAFIKTYGLLAPFRLLKRTEEKAVLDCQLILEYFTESLKSVKLSSAAVNWAIGKKHIFLTENARQLLERFRHQLQHTAALIVQVAYRNYIQRKKSRPPLAGRSIPALPCASNRSNCGSIMVSAVAGRANPANLTLNQGLQTTVAHATQQLLATSSNYASANSLSTVSTVNQNPTVAWSSESNGVASLNHTGLDRMCGGASDVAASVAGAATAVATQKLADLQNAHDSSHSAASACGAYKATAVNSSAPGGSVKSEHGCGGSHTGSASVRSAVASVGRSTASTASNQLDTSLQSCFTLHPPSPPPPPPPPHGLPGHSRHQFGSAPGSAASSSKGMSHRIRPESLSVQLHNQTTAAAAKPVPATSNVCGRRRPQPISGTPPPDCSGPSSNSSGSKGLVTDSTDTASSDFGGTRRCDQRVIEQTCLMFGLDAERPPPLPPSRTYTVAGNAKMSYPQQRVMKMDFPLRGDAGGDSAGNSSATSSTRSGHTGCRLFKGDTVTVIGASTKRGHMLVEHRGETFHIPFQFLELRHNFDTESCEPQRSAHNQLHRREAHGSYQHREQRLKAQSSHRSNEALVEAQLDDLAASRNERKNRGIFASGNSSTLPIL